MPDVIKGGYTCECGWVGNSRQAKYWHKHNTCPLIGKEPAHVPVQATPSPVFSQPVTIAPNHTQPAPEPKEVPRLTRKEEYEREFGVKIPDPNDQPESEDAATFDGESPEIPVLFIWIIAAVVLLVAGAVVFREKILGFFKGKPPAYSAPQDTGLVPI